jgi:hypothetical protein
VSHRTHGRHLDIVVLAFCNGSLREARDGKAAQLPASTADLLRFQVMRSGCLTTLDGACAYAVGGNDQSVSL